MTTLVSKSLGYVVLRSKPGGSVSKATSYAILRALPGLTVSKALGYVVLQEGGGPEPEVQIEVSKSALYVVMVPGPDGPLSYITSNALDLLSEGLATARITAAEGEALLTNTSAARVSGTVAEALKHKTQSVAYTSAAQIEVLRSTAEVIVSGLVTTTALDYMFLPVPAGVRATETTIEILRPADADAGGFGYVTVVN